MEKDHLLSSFFELGNDLLPYTWWKCLLIGFKVATFLFVSVFIPIIWLMWH